jgi:MYXO-CTERM domain-containing protein
MPSMQPTLLRNAMVCSVALLALAGVGHAAPAPADQTRQVVAQLVGPDAPAPRSGGVRTAARAPLALPAAAGNGAAAAEDSAAPSYGPLLLALLGLVLLLGLRTRRRDD